MKKKKILIVNYAPLFPIVMASQDRVVQMAKRMSQDHDVTIISSFKNEEQRLLCSQEMGKNGLHLELVKARNFDGSEVKNKFLGIIFLLKYYFTFTSSDYFYSGNNHFNNRVVNYINRNYFDIVQIQYWFNWKIFKKIRKPCVKSIDSQDILYDKREQQFKLDQNGRVSIFTRRILNRYKNLEVGAYKTADVLISITEDDKKILDKICPGTKKVVIPTGQNISYFKEYPSNRTEPVVLFYGGMSGKENVDAFWRLYLKIFPIIRSQVKNVKLLVVGANPPVEILQLNNGSDIEVTGYLDDVRPYLAVSSVMVLPLDVAAGFRSRTVEVMAMGIPVVGTHKALDNLRMVNEVNCFIHDDDAELAKYAIRLLKNEVLRLGVGKLAQDFCEQFYSIENTYGRLSEYYGRT